MRTSPATRSQAFSEAQYSRVLTALGTGIHQALPTRTIRARSRINDDSTNRRTRAIFLAANERGIPVVACARGVFVAQNRGEVHDYAQTLESRQVALAERIKALRSISL